MREAAYYKEFTQPNYARVVPVSVRVLKAVGLLEILVDKLEKLKNLTEAFRKSFDSTGLISFCNRINEYLPNAFFQSKNAYSRLKYLCEGGKLILGVRIGKGLKGTGYVLRKLPRDMKDNLLKKRNQKDIQWNEIILDNISIAKSAREMEDAGLIRILRIINRFNSIIQHFFGSLRFEAGFYLGSVNLYTTLSSIHAPISFPKPLESGDKSLCFKGLYDISLALNEKKKPVQNDIDASGKTLFVITGANQEKIDILRMIALASFNAMGLFVLLLVRSKSSNYSPLISREKMRE